MEKHVGEIQHALTALYHSDTEHAARQNADRYLRQFQKRPEAWQVADSLFKQQLHESNFLEQVYFYAAQTLQKKILNDLEELPGPARGSLFEALIGNLKRPMPKSVVDRLCSAVSALLIQTPQWDGVVDRIFAELSAVEQRLSLLTLLTVLPREYHDAYSDLPSSFLSSFGKQLDASVPKVLQFLAQCAQASPDFKCLKMILDTLVSWLNFVTVPVGLILSHPMFQCVFSVLSSVKEEKVFSSASEAVVALLQRYNDPEHDGAMMQALIPRVMGFKQALVEAIAAEDELRARSLIQMITELGQSYMALICDAKDMGQQQLVEMVFECTLFPDVNVASVTFEFWYELLEELLCAYPKDDSAGRILIERFRPVLVKLVQRTLTLAELPEDWDDMETAEQDEERRLRYDTTQVLLECSSVIGVNDCLLYSIQKFREALVAFSTEQKPELLRQAEASLYGIRIVGIRARDLSTIAGLQEMFQSFPSLPPWDPLHSTALVTVGRYAEFFSTQPKLLETMFRYAVSALDVISLVPSAACAVRYLCQAAGQVVAPVVMNLLPHVQKVTGNSLTELLTGIATALNHLPPKEASERLLKLIHPLLDQIMAHLKVVPGQVLDSRQSDAIGELLRNVSTVVSAYCPRKGRDWLYQDSAGPKHPLCTVMQPVLTCIDMLTIRFPQDTKITENACRVIKYAARSARLGLLPLFHPIVAFLVQRFDSSTNSSYLYCSSVFVGEYAERKECSEQLVDMIRRLFTRALSILSGAGLKPFAENPFIVADFFDLALRALKKMPTQMLSLKLLPSIIKCAVVGLRVEHGEANRSIVFFLLYLLSISTPGNSLNAAFGPAMQAMFFPELPELIHAVLMAIAWELPMCRVNDASASLMEVLFSMSTMNEQLFFSLLENTLPRLESTRVPEGARVTLLKTLMENKSNPDKRDAGNVFRHAVLDFAKACRRKRTPLLQTPS